MRIALSGKHGTGLSSLVDEGFETSHSWALAQNGYAYRRQWVNGRKRTVYLHWEALKQTPLPGYHVDHINRDKLDNRRENLRIVERSINAFNTSRKPGASGVRGVRRRDGAWVAEIGAGKGKMRHLGTFETKEAAIAARDYAYRIRLGLGK